MKIKRCSECGNVKNILEFYPCKITKSGYLEKCKKCVFICDHLPEMKNRYNRIYRDLLKMKASQTVLLQIILKNDS